MPRNASIAALAILLALGACKGGQKQQGAGNAQGQILPGSTSDAMLPVDTVRSQAPLAPRSETAGKAAPDDAASDAADTAPEAAPDAAPTPDKPTAPVQ